MENEKMQVVLHEGQTELVIREGKAQNILDVKPPVKIALVGVIGAPTEFLARRFQHCVDAAKPDCIEMLAHFDPTRLHVLVNREDVKITLVIDEHDEYKRGTVVGSLELHPKFVEFGINDSKKLWEPNELGQFLKMNRAFFPDRSKNMTLVSELKNFVGKVDSTIEQQKEDKGSFKDNFSAVVTSNLPDSFSVQLPVFKGTKPEIIDVEFYASVSGREIFVQLVSPGANELFESIRDTVIDEQIEAIRKIAPNIVIIEQ